jgi:alpha-galactosidase
MVDELLVAQAQWLPQYIHAIPAAVERLKSPQVKTRNWEGAARLKVRPVEELRAAKAKLSVSEGHSLGTKVMG